MDICDNGSSEGSFNDFGTSGREECHFWGTNTKGFNTLHDLLHPCQRDPSFVMRAVEAALHVQ